MNAIHFADLAGAMSAIADALAVAIPTIRPDFADAVFESKRAKINDPRDLLMLMRPAGMTFALAVVGEGLDTEVLPNGGGTRRRYRYLVPIAQWAEGEDGERLYFDRVEAWENFFHPDNQFVVTVGPLNLPFVIEGTEDVSPLFVETAENDARVGHTHMRRVTVAIDADICLE